MPRDIKHSTRTLLTALAFFASGCAGLVYQVVWQRILTLHSGIGTYSVAMIVAAFMAGLGLGSHFGGLLSTRLAPRHALAAFGLLESGIGLFGALSCTLYYDLLYLKVAWLYSPAWRAGILHFLGLLLPTLLMGMTLPFLVRATVRTVPSAARSVALLYGINVLGASLGAWLAPWVLIPRVGMRGAVLFAAGANATAALVALLLAGLMSREVFRVAEMLQLTTETVPTVQRRFALWMALYALSGFCALALEIVWFRLLDIGVKSTAFTFGTLLSLYLLGSGVGCLVGIPIAEKLRRPLRAFLVYECLLIGYSGLAIVLIGRFPSHWEPLAWFSNYWAQGMGFALGGAHDAAAILKLYLGLPLFLFGPPTVLMGLAFTTLQKAVHDDARTSGRKVGLLQAANITGCVAGSLLVGLLSLTWLGSTGTLRLLMLVGVVFAAVGWWTGEARRVFVSLAGVLLGLAVALPGQEHFWKRLHGAESRRALVEEDATGVAAVAESRQSSGWVVYVNGKAHSWLPFSGIHTELGAVAALVHPAPRDVAIIGLGSGNTAWAAGCRPETQSVTVFEIAGPQPRLLARLAAAEDLQKLRSFLHDPRIRIRIADGRNALGHESDRFDLIEADALWPHVAGSGNLYSIEFFELCARKLRPGGVMCTWAPTARVMATFMQVFSHVLKGPDRSVLIGSREPIPIANRLWLERLDTPAVRDYLGGTNKGIRELLETLSPPQERQRFHRRDVNRDLYPRDEFAVR